MTEFAEIGGNEKGWREYGLFPFSPVLGHNLPTKATADAIWEWDECLLVLRKVVRDDRSDFSRLVFIFQKRRFASRRGRRRDFCDLVPKRRRRRRLEKAWESRRVQGCSGMVVGMRTGRWRGDAENEGARERVLGGVCGIKKQRACTMGQRRCLR